jgi:hypothetical protein
MAARLIDDPGTCEWLEGEPKLEWDAGNRAKNEKHGVETSDVEAVMAI